MKPNWETERSEAHVVEGVAGRGVVVAKNALPDLDVWILNVDQGIDGTAHCPYLEGLLC